MIRDATIYDLKGIERLVFLFYEDGIKEYIHFDSATVRQTIINLIENHIFIVAEENKNIIGVIAGAVAKSIFDSKDLIVQESIWYVEKEYRGIIGIRLLQAFEEKCNSIKASVVLVGLIMNQKDGVDSLLQRKGYHQFESNFIRRVNNGTSA